MKFSLALFLKYKGHVILLLLLCIFISLLLSDIPWIINFLNNKNTQEGMITDDSINTMNKLLNDKYATTTQKLAGIKSVADMMENLKDQTQYLSILNDGTRNENEKLVAVTKLIDSYLKSSTSLMKSSTNNLTSKDVTVPEDTPNDSAPTTTTTEPTTSSTTKDSTSTTTSKTKDST